jgi:hypothetical protein
LIAGFITSTTTYMMKSSKGINHLSKRQQSSPPRSLNLALPVLIRLPADEECRNHAAFHVHVLRSSLIEEESQQTQRHEQTYFSKGQERREQSPYLNIF